MTPDDERAAPPPLLDVETTLADLARVRRRAASPTRKTARYADKLATYIAPHIEPESRETAGLTLVTAAAWLTPIVAEDAGRDSFARILCNMLALAGQRLVSDARTATSGRACVSDGLSPDP